MKRPERLTDFPKEAQLGKSRTRIQVKILRFETLPLTLSLVLADICTRQRLWGFVPKDLHTFLLAVTYEGLCVCWPLCSELHHN